MFKISKKTNDRFADTVKNYQRIAQLQKERDVSEADTVTLVKDIMSDVFGFDKYQELTSEQQIKGQFCDLAVKLDDKIKMLIEVKSAGVTLNTSHIRQAITYGVNQGIEWVVLTNALQWKIYKIKFSQPPEEEELVSFDFVSLNPKNEDDQQKLFLLSREGLLINVMQDYHQVAQIFNKHTIAVLLQSEPVIIAIRRELKKLFPELKVELTELEEMLVSEVIKRDTVDGEKYKEAENRIKKALKKLATPVNKKVVESSDEKADT